MAVIVCFHGEIISFKLCKHHSNIWDSRRMAECKVAGAGRWAKMLSLDLTDWCWLLVIGASYSDLLCLPFHSCKLGMLSVPIHRVPKKILFELLKLCMCMSMQCPWGPEVGVRSLVLELWVAWAAPCWCWEFNLVLCKSNKDFNFPSHLPSCPPPNPQYQV